VGAQPPDGEAATAQVTVVVVSYDGAHLLPDCLRALAAQDLPEDQMAVWVVDNGSRDGSAELLARDFPWVRVLANPVNDGFAGGNNLALRQVRTPFVALLNNDARPEPDWLRRLVATFDGPGGARVGAATSKVLFWARYLPLQLRAPELAPGGLDRRRLGVRLHGVSVDGRDVTGHALMERLTYPPEDGRDGARFRWTRPAGTLYVPVEAAGRAGPVRVGLRLAAEKVKPVELAWPGGGTTVKAGPEPEEVEVELAAEPPLVEVVNNAGGLVLRDGYGADRGYQQPDRGQYERAEEVFAFCGAAVALRTAAGAEAGWFDDDFFLYYEDTDLSWRLRALGWSIRYQPRAVVRHIHAATSQEWSPRFEFHTGRNRLLNLAKNAPAPLAAREALRYPLTAASLALQGAAQARGAGRRPPLAPSLLRLRVMGSYLRLLPAMLAKRRRLGARATVGRRHLARWLVLR
jgi:GT2 family glycosyltransferase